MYVEEEPKREEGRSLVLESLEIGMKSKVKQESEDMNRELSVKYAEAVGELNKVERHLQQKLEIVRVLEDKLSKTKREHEIKLDNMDTVVSSIHNIMDGNWDITTKNRLKEEVNKLGRMCKHLETFEDFGV